MSEYTIGWLASLSGVGLVASSTFYWKGGRSKKWLRRWLGSFVMALTIWLVANGMGNFSPWMFLLYPILVLGYSLGYGGVQVGEKLIRRCIYAGTILCSGLLMAILIGGHAWSIFGAHVLMASLTVNMAYFNPVPAASEEYFVSMFLNLALCIYPFIGGG